MTKRWAWGAAAGTVLAATPAHAAMCGGAIDARFSEAAKLCPAGTTPVPTASPTTVAIPNGDPVSVSMPGYRRRLSAAVRQVKRSGGTNNDALIAAIGRRYRIDPHLLSAMVSTESGGRVDAVSNKGALGLMQVMPGTARSLGVDPRRLRSDRVLAVSTGAAYLKKLQAQFGNNVPLVVAAYNAGPGAVQKYRGIPNYRETRGYVGSVMSGYLSRRSGAAR